MKITVNDEVVTLQDGATVASLAARRGLSDKGGVAVAVNGRLVRRPDWESCTLRELDSVMIINAAYGG